MCENKVIAFNTTQPMISANPFQLHSTEVFTYIHLKYIASNRSHKPDTNIGYRYVEVCFVSGYY